MRCKELAIKNPPSIRSRTVVEADTPGVLSRAGSDVGVPGVSTARPPTIVSSLGKAVWTAGAGTIGQRDVRNVDAFELLHPDRHLVGEKGYDLHH